MRQLSSRYHRSGEVDPTPAPSGGTAWRHAVSMQAIGIQLVAPLFGCASLRASLSRLDQNLLHPAELLTRVGERWWVLCLSDETTQSPSGCSVPKHVLGIPAFSYDRVRTLSVTSLCPSTDSSATDWEQLHNGAGSTPNNQVRTSKNIQFEAKCLLCRTELRTSEQTLGQQVGGMSLLFAWNATTDVSPRGLSSRGRTCVCRPFCSSMGGRKI